MNHGDSENVQIDDFLHEKNTCAFMQTEIKSSSLFVFFLWSTSHFVFVYQRLVIDIKQERTV